MKLSPVLYTDYNSFMQQHFSFKVQKISINAGFTCPNRDGTVGRGGCTYCNNQTFSPAYCCTEKSVTEQLEEGKTFFARKYPQMKYIAYFQAYTNTFAANETLRMLYEEALAVPDVVGLIIGTRPDCLPESLLDYLEELSRHTFVLTELGIESIQNKVLDSINRGHTFECTQEAILRLDSRKIMVGGHVIIGLPGENHENIMQQARTLSQLPLTTLKLHQLQLIKGTKMADEYVALPYKFKLYTLHEYIDTVIDYLELLRPSLVIERFISQSPKSLLIAPDWGVKNHEFIEMVKKRMRQRNTWQGRIC